MSIPPESIQVGQCYLTTSGRVIRIEVIMPDGRIRVASRPGASWPPRAWQKKLFDAKGLTAAIERPVPCDWTLESDGA